MPVLLLNSHCLQYIYTTSKCKPVMEWCISINTNTACQFVSCHNLTPVNPSWLLPCSPLVAHSCKYMFRLQQTRLLAQTVQFLDKPVHPFLVQIVEDLCNVTGKTPQQEPQWNARSFNCYLLHLVSTVVFSLKKVVGRRLPCDPCAEPGQKCQPWLVACCPVSNTSLPRCRPTEPQHVDFLYQAVFPSS